MEYCIPYLGNTVDFLLYMIYIVGEKNGKTWGNEVDTKAVKIATSDIRESFFSILKRNYFIKTLSNFLWENPFKGPSTIDFRITFSLGAVKEI